MRNDDAKGAVLLVMAVIAAAAIFGAFYLRGEAREAAAAARDAGERLEEERALAAEYREASPDKLVISADVTEAQSSAYISEALRRNGISQTQSSAVYGNPQETAGLYSRITNQITVKGAKFEAILKFLKDVQDNRPQLTLIEADISREGTADRWAGTLTLGALIPATPRS